MNAQLDLSHLVRKIRGHLGLTQEKFAARLGVAFPTVNRWENGRANPSPLALQKIEGILRKMGKEGNGLLKRYFPKQK